MPSAANIAHKILGWPVVERGVTVRSMAVLSCVAIWVFEHTSRTVTTVVYHEKARVTRLISALRRAASALHTSAISSLRSLPDRVIFTII